MYSRSVVILNLPGVLWLRWVGSTTVWRVFWIPLRGSRARIPCMKEMVCVRDWPASKQISYHIRTNRVCFSREWFLRSSFAIEGSRLPTHFLSPGPQPHPYHNRQVKIQRYLFHIPLFGLQSLHRGANGLILEDTPSNGKHSLTILVLVGVDNGVPWLSALFYLRRENES